MIFNKEESIRQVNDLLKVYNSLQICSMNDTEIIIDGSIIVNRSWNGFTVFKEYLAKIVIPLESDNLPYVIDSGNHIDKSYPHRYKNGMLCLETDSYIRIRFIDGFCLEKWMRDIVEPYYFSYEYYQRYGEFPFGERGHGLTGVVQTYSDFFCEPDFAKTIKLMKSISTQKYRGHSLCPCGSGKKLRICHGPLVMKYYSDNRLKLIVRNDYLVLEEAVKNK